MYFWKIDKLKRQLIEQGLSEKHLFYYILIFITVMSIGWEILAIVPYKESSFWEQCEASLAIFITIIGTIAAFRANGGESGIKFAERYFSIGFVISIRFIIFLIPMIPLMIAAYYLTYVWQYGWSEPTDAELETMFPNSANITEFVVMSIWDAFLYIRIVKHIRDVAKAKLD